MNTAFSKARLGSALILSTALRDYGLLCKFTAFFSTVGFVHRVFFVHRLSQINTDFLISKDIVIITDFFRHGNPRLFQRHGLAPH